MESARFKFGAARLAAHRYAEEKSEKSEPSEMCGRDPPCRGRNKNKVRVKPRPDCPRRLEAKRLHNPMLRRLPAAVKRALRRARKRRRRLRKKLARMSRCVKAAAVTMSNAESPQCTDEDVPDVPDASTMQTGPDALRDWVSILPKCDLLLPIAIGQGYVPSPVCRSCKPALISTQHPIFEGISLERL
jgi:hypothetical protein